MPQATMVITDITANAQMINKALEQNGFAIKKNHAYDVGRTIPSNTIAWIATHKERGVRFAIQQQIKAGLVHSPFHSKEHIDIDCKLRTERGTMRTHYMHNYFEIETDKQVDECIKTLLALNGAVVSNPPIVKKSQLYKPLNFAASMISDVGTWTALHCVYQSCKILGIAAVANDLRISLDGVYKPGEECWFYIIGEAAGKLSGASPEIIVREIDGELVYYPIMNKRITNNFKPLNTYIDFTAFTELDKLLIEKAIERYLKEM